MFGLIVSLLLCLQVVFADCIRLEKSCTGTIKTIYQINNSTNYFSFYLDEVTSYYDGNGCSEDKLAYQVVIHRTYDTTYCMGTAESVWYKVINKNNVKQSQLVSSCGSSLAKKFVDVSTLDCTVDGTDPFFNLRSMINTQLYSCIKFNQKQPEISGATRSEEKCNDEFDMGSSWITDFMIVMYIILGVLAVCVIILIIYVVTGPKKKEMKRETKV